MQLARSVPPATVSVVLPGHRVVSGRPPALPLPSQGAADVEVEGVGQLGGVRAGAELPLASVTKLMTALLVLKDHPLALGQQGPEITVSAAEASAYAADVAADDSVVRVAAGERVSEFQALEALLIPSADNMADILAAWDSGSVARFVQRMNAQASKLGLRQTHYADPDGLDPASAGSAADMVRLASYVMAVPVLRHIVAMPEVTLPLAGTVNNYDTDIGHDGIVGVKTGNTSEAGGNFVFAAQRAVGGREFTVLGAVLDQGGQQPLQAALDEAERLSASAFSQIREVTVLPAGTSVLRLETPWGGRGAAATERPVDALGVTGEAVRLHAELTRATSRLRSVKAGQLLANVAVSFPGGSETVPAVATARVAPASLGWRLGRI